MIQKIIDRAVAIATKAALNGHPVARVVWFPPQSASDSPMGMFASQEYHAVSPSDTQPWDA